MNLDSPDFWQGFITGVVINVVAFSLAFVVNKIKRGISK